MKKIRNKNGESLIEVLVGLLVITLVFVLLTGAITTSARINKKAKETDLSFTYENAEKSNGVDAKAIITLTATDGSQKQLSADIDLYKTTEDDIERYFYTVKDEEIQDEENK